MPERMTLPSLYIFTVLNLICRLYVYIFINKTTAHTINYWLLFFLVIQQWWSIHICKLTITGYLNSSLIQTFLCICNFSSFLFRFAVKFIIQWYLWMFCSLDTLTILKSFFVLLHGETRMLSVYYKVFFLLYFSWELHCLQCHC